MVFQESDCYREIDPDGIFFKYKKDLFAALDKFLDDDTFRNEQVTRSINRVHNLNINEQLMFKELHTKLN
jgi:Fe-S-cluster formation regulator IscX/YfhJ